MKKTLKYICVVIYLSINLFADMSCDESTLRTNKEYDVKGKDIDVRTGAGSNYPKVINKRASEIFKETHYVKLDSSIKVMEECIKQDWSKIRVIQPDYLSKSHQGWILSKYLKKDNNSFYTEDDFNFSKEDKKYKDTIIKGVNYLSKNHKSCKEYIDITSATKSMYKGTKENPVFYVTCGNGESAVNVFFSKDEVKKNSIKKSFTWIKQSTAIDICKSTLKQKLNYPSTADFSIFDTSVYEAPNGNTRVQFGFSAKNAFNVESKLLGVCLFNVNGLIESSINDKK